MKQLLLICAVVALVGCGEKENGNTGVVNPNEPLPKPPPANIDNPIVEKAIREYLGKPAAELTQADLEKVKALDFSSNKLTSVNGLEKLTQLTWLNLGVNKLTDVKDLEKLSQLEKLWLADNRLTDVKGLEKLTQLKVLYLKNNPDLTKSQIDELQKALPKCKIEHNAK